MLGLKQYLLEKGRHIGQSLYEKGLAQNIVAATMILGLVVMGYKGCNENSAKNAHSIQQKVSTSLDQIVFPYYKPFKAEETLGCNPKSNYYKCFKETK